jgi:signal transduction histidine kinase
LIELRKHQVILDLENELYLYVDENLISQVIQNLLINAIKYTPFDGIIKISTKIHPLYVKVSVKDDGIGITEDEKEFLFKKFGKIERYGQGWEIITDGAGLGLFICKKIIRAHGGTIGVYSEGRNEGSTFNLKLPRMG